MRRLNLISVTALMNMVGIRVWKNSTIDTVDCLIFNLYFRKLSVDSTHYNGGIHQTLSELMTEESLIVFEYCMSFHLDFT
ncbi:hypothetical protein M5K25_025710 [Dendrobium thyrsiflorum]|uniref:Uncharacterized protein n=1 Tax=Dendrobium thyrsiflorum TaxID=117978 RepID=A0ABD0U9U2_DENTH